MFNKELEAGMLAINVRLDNIQKDLQDIQSKLEESPIPQKPAESPFLTKEGLLITSTENRNPQNRMVM